MKKGLVELVIIIDKSGSMNGLEQDVIGGFNSLIKEQTKYDGEVNVTTLFFNHKVNYIIKGVNVKSVRQLTGKDYIPSGCTALLDAVGNGISYMKTKIMSMNDDNQPEHVIFSIMTDGKENSSKEYTYPQIKNMIENQKKEGWDFLFQASNIDEKAEGKRLGISIEDIDRIKPGKAGMKCYFEVCAAKISSKISKKRK